MGKYIDKSAVVAEIKKSISLFQKEKKVKKWTTEASMINIACLSARIATLKEILSFIDTLEVKDVDLEKEMSKYLGDDWKKDADGLIEKDMMDFAKHFFELGLKAKLQ